MDKLGKKKFFGVVVSDKMDKSATVAVSRRVKHKHFEKYYQKVRKFKAHDPQNQCKVGDEVCIVECAPISKTKRFAIKEVIKKAKVA